MDELNLPEAPYKSAPSFSRQSVLTGPDWRWQQACTENFCERQHTPYIHSRDPYVVMAKRLQWLLSGKFPRVWLEYKWKPAYELIMVATEDRFITMRRELDAAVIRNVHYEDLSIKIPWISPDQFRLYKKWFFDLSGINAIHSWMEDHVFKPALTGRRKNLANKLLTAYYSDTSSSAGSRMGSSDDLHVMSNIMNNERMRTVAEYILGDTNLPIEIYVGAMESAFNNIQADQKERDAKDGTNKTLEPELVHQLTQMTRLRTGEEMEEHTDVSGIENNYDMTYIRERWAQVPKPDKSGATEK